MSEPEFNCPVPNTHRRLIQLHRIWHKLEAAYHDPNEFAIELNSFLSTARTVTWVLQKECNGRKGFDEWYLERQGLLGADDLLVWAKNARNEIQKRGELETESTAVASLLFTDATIELEPSNVPPLLSAREVALLLAGDALPERLRSQAVVAIERRWTLPEIDGSDLLDVCGHVYTKLAETLRSAHHLFGADTFVISASDHHELFSVPPHPSGRLPCMVAPDVDHIAYWSVAEERFLDGGVFETTLGSKSGSEFEPEISDAVSRFEGLGDIPDEASAQARWYHRAGRRCLEIDGYHVTVCWLLRSGSVIDQFDITPGSIQEKAVNSARVAHTVSRLGADGVIITSEAYFAPELPVFHRLRNVRPQDRPDRIEALITVLSTRDGLGLQWVSPFVRQGDGSIWVGEASESIVEEFGLLRQVVGVWDGWK